MNKVLLLNKSSGITSREAINKLTKIFHTKKIGHTGTLDPLATGVLVVCINEATKLCELLTQETKEYIATIKLGISTDTLDITGNIQKQEKIKKYSPVEIQRVLDSFLQTYKQEVPLYSAVRINGKKLYEYARQNIPVKLPQREVTIYDIKLLDYKDDLIKFQVKVSKGTYIRSLIKDICIKLNTIGCMQELIRTKQGIFDLKNSYTIENIIDGNYELLSIEDVLKNFPKKNLSFEEYQKVKNGAILPNDLNHDKTAFVYKGKIIAIYQIYPKDPTKIKPYRMFNN